MSIATQIQNYNDGLVSAYSSVQQKGGIIPSNKNLVNLQTAIQSIPSGGGQQTVLAKDVNFFDYKGNITNSYTKAEFLALTELPALPTDPVMTYTAWNWTLANAKTYVTNYGRLHIGGLCQTTDGKMRIYINLFDNMLKPTLNLGVNGSVTIDWGDGSSTNSMTGTSVTTMKSQAHTYTSPGDYVIEITPSNSSTRIGIVGTSSVHQLIYNNGLYSYCSAITKVELPANVTFGNRPFHTAYSLKEINIPASTTFNGTAYFQACYSLRHLNLPSGLGDMDTSFTYYCCSLQHISIPKSVTTISANALYYCFSLQDICLPDGFAKINSNTFSTCYALKNVVFPASVNNIGTSAFTSCNSIESFTFYGDITQISSSAFNNCRSAQYFDFTHCTSVPTLNSNNVFNGTPDDSVIIVPDNLYNSWISATNWSDSAIVSKIIKESEWDG